MKKKLASILATVIIASSLGCGDMGRTDDC